MANNLPSGWSEATEEEVSSYNSSKNKLPAGWSEVSPEKGVNITMNASPSGIPDNKTPSIDDMADTLGKMESSGNYGAIGKPVKGKRAIGKYQIMEQNIPEWSKEILGREVSRDEFYKNPELQDKIAKGKIAKYLSQGYSINDIPALWLSGKPLKRNNRVDKVAGTDVQSYADKFKNILGMPREQLYKAAASLSDTPKLEKFIRAIAPSAQKVGDTAAAPLFGAMEGVGSAGASAANLALDALNAYKGSKYHLQSPGFRDKIQPGMTNDILYGAGKFGGEIAGGGAAYKALGSVPKLGNEASMLANLFRGAGAGAITGEEGPGGRAGSAAIGGALSPISQLTNSAIANRISRSAGNEINKSSKGFEKFFDSVPSDEIVIPEGDIDLRTIRKAIPSKERAPLDEYLKDPTIKNAHKAQSILGAQERKVDSEIKKHGGSFSRTARINAYRGAKDSILKGIDKSLEKLPSKNESYQAERSNYKKNVVPYLEEEINLYRNGEISANKMIKELEKNYPWIKKTMAGKEHGKSLKAKKFLDSLFNSRAIKQGAGIGLGALGLNEAKNVYGRYNEQ